MPQDLAHFETVARRTVDAMPVAFRGPAQAVALRVVDWPPPDILTDLDINDPLELTGLYDGIPMTEKSFSDQPEGPDIVWLFRRAIMDEWADRGNVTLAELVAHVTVHEFAHHFGWSDEDIAAIDRWWD